MTARRGMVLLAAGLVLLVGCGSTVRTPVGPQGAAPASDELAAARRTLAQYPEDALPQYATRPSGEGTVRPGDDHAAVPDRQPVMGSTSPPSGARAAAASPPARAPGRHPGVTDEQITFGFIYIEGTEAFIQGVGAEATGGDPRRQIEAVVEAVNGGGGVAGRQLRLLAYPFRAGQPIDTQLQAACAHFTQDHRTFAVSSNIGGLSGGGGAVLVECLAAHEVALIEHVSPGDAQVHARYPGISYAPPTLNADRVAALMTDALIDARWFGDEPVIGVNSLDTPIWRRVVAEVLVPRLARHGHRVEQEFYYVSGETGTDGLSAYPAATLRFKTAGVTHVLNLPNNPYFFANAAESQGWRPKWSVYSDLLPASWAPGTPAAQLAGSLGIGWAPSRDVPPAERGDPVNPAEVRCTEIMRAAGEHSTAPVAAYYQLSACTAVFFLEAALARAPEISRAGLAEGVSALEDDHLDPVTWRTHFMRGRGDGLGAYRLLAFASECGCYRYASGRQPVQS